MTSAATKTIAADIRDRLDGLADTPTREKYHRIVPGAKVLGVRVPAVRAVAADVHRDYPDLTLEQAAALLDTFAKQPIREEMLAGIFILARFARKLEQLPWKRVERWTGALDNWETTDQLASNVAARVLHAHLEHLPALQRFAKSKSAWTRRFALATAADLTHAGRGNVDTALTVCGMALADEDPMIQTCIAWALREATKADAAATFAFLGEHAAKMQPRTLREAAQKLPASKRASLGLPK